MTDENDIVVRRHERMAIVHLGVRLGATELQKWSEALEDLVSRRDSIVVIDFADTEFISSQAVGVLLAARTAAIRNKGRIILANPQPMVKRILEITRTDSLFEIVEDMKTLIPPRYAHGTEQAPEGSSEK